MLITAILVQTVAREVGLKKTCSTTIYTFEVITRSMRLGLYGRPFCLDFYFLLHPLRQKPLWGSLENSRLAPCESSASRLQRCWSRRTTTWLPHFVARTRTKKRCTGFCGFQWVSGGVPASCCFCAAGLTSLNITVCTVFFYLLRLIRSTINQASRMGTNVLDTKWGKSACVCWV